MRTHETSETTIPELCQLINSIIETLPPLGEPHQTGDTSLMDGPDPTEAGTKRLTEPLFLKKILLENSGDHTNELTTLALSVHAVMLESGFVWFNPNSSDNKFSFSKELLSVTLKYTLPKLVEFVTVTFQSLSHDKVVVYGSFNGNVRRVYLDKTRVFDILKLDEEVIYKEVFMFWRMVKEGLVTPLLISLCDKSGLELPPCFMFLPTELKRKIVKSLTGASLAKMACVCRETRRMASSNALWKQKIWEEARHLVTVDGGRGSVNWKSKFACFWIRYQQKLSPVIQQHVPDTFESIVMSIRRNRLPRDPDSFEMFNGDDDLHDHLQMRRFSPGGQS
ncbi:unnamed protein product [Eruca vesicaria subsp. sativa]|uniref:F-box domain-containing protein n=1 Tax=Eruca vesicaria subsp. sativa TaxID=29727 RepID=A0ABC8LHI0_ERUVS|nr:unnamed protein product [Eruca vesicaria subsp. sativa]